MAVVDVKPQDIDSRDIDSQDIDSQDIDSLKAESQDMDSNNIDTQEGPHPPAVAVATAGPGSLVQRFLYLLWQKRWQIIMLGCLLGAVHLRVENTSLRAALGDAQEQLRLADSLRSASATSAEAEAENAAARTKRCMLEATHLRAELGDVQAALVDARAHRMTLQAALDDARALIDELREAEDAAAEEKARDEATRAARGIRWGTLRQVGHRAEWRARLWHIPHGYGWKKACERTPLEGRKIVSGLPNWCEVTVVGVWGHWVV